MEKPEIKAYAKINLGLDVLRRREDGYHEVRMIMQTVDLYDTLLFEKSGGGGIEILTDRKELPCDEGNLIYRAWQVFCGETGQDMGVRITLQKRIPVAAGMAGGSSDAAAAFLALNELAGNLLTTEQLCRIAVRVGADVPYCIAGGTALSEGIGEVLTPLPAPPKAHLVVAKPPIEVSTAFVYGNLRLDEAVFHPDIDGMVQAVFAGDLKGITDRMGNVLESVTLLAHPVIGEIKRLCIRGGAMNALMSGSGPTVFAVYDDLEKAEQSAAALRESGLASEVYVTGFVEGRKRYDA